MSFVTTKEDIQASKKIALSTVDRFTAAASPGIALDAIALVLTGYFKVCISDGILDAETAERVLEDFHGSCLSEIAPAEKRELH